MRYPFKSSVWSDGRATEIAQFQPILSKTEPSQARQTPLFPYRSVIPDISLFLLIIWFLMVWEIITFPFFRELLKSCRQNLPAVKASKLPCCNCQFFNKNPYLKCAVHPTIVMTEAAIDCPDSCSRTNCPGS